MRGERGNDGRWSGIYRRISGSVHRQIQKPFQGEWSQSVSENQREIEGEIKWQPASKVVSSTGKSKSQ
jgi:hypothetical protein